MSAKKVSRYILIKGKYWIFYPDQPNQGPEPDGDTVTFEPDQPQLLRSLKWNGRFGPKLNSRGTIPIRFEGIDALETHYQGKHQNLTLANAARDHLLKTLGFTGVQFNPNRPNKVSHVNNNPLTGYIISGGIDGNGRALGFVYTGNSDEPDGSEIWLDNVWVKKSININLVQEGLAYAELYTSLPKSLTPIFVNEVKAAKLVQKGIWNEEDISLNDEANLDLNTVEDLVFWPKLFRRVIAFFKDYTDIGDFDWWLREDVINRDDRLLLPTGELGNMHDMVEVDVSSQTMKLKYNPEDIIILPDNG